MKQNEFKKELVGLKNDNPKLPEIILALAAIVFLKSEGKRRRERNK